VQAVVEGGVWKVKPMGDFMPTMSNKQSQQQQKMKRSKFCEGLGGQGCGVPDCGEIHMVGKADVMSREESQAFKNQGGINAAGRKQGWERIEVQIDSGAIDTVAPKSVGGHLPIRETEAVRRNLGYVAANGTKIANHGERVLRGSASNGTAMSLAVQVADVSRTLASVNHMNKAGNVVVFDGHESYTLNKSTGRITEIAWKDGKFIMDLWLQIPQSGRKEVPTQNRYEALAAVEEGGEDVEECQRYEAVVGSPGFSWRDALW
jgi:hypothetical protein